MLNGMDWLAEIEGLEDMCWDPALLADLQARHTQRAWAHTPPINFYTPTFKAYQTSEISACSNKNAWPAISITGADCKLQCDHCKAQILKPMIPARTPEVLWQVVNEIVAKGAQGMLLTGGSNHRNEVEYAPYYATLRRIKDSFPEFRIGVHAALVDAQAAQALEDCGIDVAMMDVIGAQDTITQVYHLRRTVEDFEQTLENLVNTRMRVVPHIVIGLHYGALLGEWAALEMLTRHLPDAVVLVVVMPFYAPGHRPFKVPDPHEVGAFFLKARQQLASIPLLLGCARPPGEAKLYMDGYAVMAGLDGIAHPAEGMVALAKGLGREVKITPACCSMSLTGWIEDTQSALK
ncbi:radical SAM protein [Thiorhodospira sibirica]|uniref:radical SAM protein n=1 Tax=Thiorhodospira sibirica TaxID=154347 RepID=UPI00022C462D